MTGYESKRAMAQDRVNYGASSNYPPQPAQDATMQSLKDLARSVCDEVGKAAFAQPAQEPVATVQCIHGITIGYLEIMQPVGTKLYTTPPQRPWVEPTGNEWFEFWRVSQVADATEAEIDFADFLIIAQAVITKLKDKNT